MKHNSFIALMVAGAAFGTNAAMADSFDEALAKAYSANPTLQSARASTAAVDENVSAAYSGFRPYVSAVGTYGRSSTETSTAPGTSTDLDPKTMTLSVTQSLFAGGQTLAAIEQARYQVAAQRARLKNTEQTILLAAATAYLNVVRDQGVMELNISNEQVLSRQLDATRDRFNVGEITRTDVHIAEARLARAKAERIGAEGALEASRAAYENVIGAAPQSLTPTTRSFDLPATLDGALALAAADSPGVTAAKNDDMATREAVSGTRGRLFPSVDLSGSAKRSLDTVSDGYWANAYTGMVTLSVPLYQQGTVYSALTRAKRQAAAARLNYDQAVRDSRESVRKAWENLSSTRARIGAFQAQVKASETALEGVQKEASVGSRTVLDVLDAEQELLDARVNLVESQRDMTLASLNMLATVGRLTAKDLNLSVDLYDADRHYRSER